MKRKIKVLVASALTGSALMTMAQPALADGDPSDCGSGKLCVWRDIHYVSSGSRYTHLDTTLWRASLPSTYDGEASSAYNHGTGGQGAYLYKPQRCAAGGTRFYMAANNGDSDFTNGSPSGNFQDAVRSLTFNSKTLISQCQAA